MKNLKDHNNQPDIRGQKAAIAWIKKKVVELPTDKQLMLDGIALIGTKIQNYESIRSKEDLMAQVEAGKANLEKKKAKEDAKNFNPKTCKQFFEPYSAGDDVIIYHVKNTKEGQRAVRMAIDAEPTLGYKSNVWCLIARKENFGARQQADIAQMTEAQKERIGLYDDDQLSVGWGFWNDTYKAIPKRIAFYKDHPIGFSANSEAEVVWWNLDDIETYSIPYTKEFRDEIINRGYYSSEIGDMTEEELENLVDDLPYCDIDAHDDKSVERKIEEKKQELERITKSTDVDLLKKYARSEDKDVRYAIANNVNAPTEVLALLIDDKDPNIRTQVAMSSNASEKMLIKLASDSNRVVKLTVGENKNATMPVYVELLKNDVWRCLQEKKFMSIEAYDDPEIRSLIARAISDDSKASIIYLAEEVVSQGKDKDGFYLELLKKYASIKSYGTSSTIGDRGANAIMRLYKQGLIDRSIAEDLILANPTISVKSVFIDEKSFNQALAKLAKSTKRKDVLLRLASRPEILKYIAKNKNCPEDLLEKAVEDMLKTQEYKGLEETIMEATSPKLLRSIFRLDITDRMKMYFTWNPNTPADILEKLVENKNFNIRNNLATNPSSNATVLRTIANELDLYDHDSQVFLIGNIIENENCPIDLSQKLTALKDKLTNEQLESWKRRAGWK